MIPIFSHCKTEALHRDPTILKSTYVLTTQMGTDLKKA